MVVYKKQKNCQGTVIWVSAGFTLKALKKKYKILQNFKDHLMEYIDSNNDDQKTFQMKSEFLGYINGVRLLK